MLVLLRKVGESIVIGNKIIVRVAKEYIDDQHSVTDRGAST